MSTADATAYAATTAIRDQVKRLAALDPADLGKEARGIVGRELAIAAVRLNSVVTAIDPERVIDAMTTSGNDVAGSET